MAEFLGFLALAVGALLAVIAGLVIADYIKYPDQEEE